MSYNPPAEEGKTSLNKTLLVKLPILHSKASSMYIVRSLLTCSTNEVGGNMSLTRVCKDVYDLTSIR